MAVVNYASKYQSAVAEAFYDTNLRSADLWNSPSNASISFLDAKHVKVPRIYITKGRTTRTRGTIKNHTNDNYSTDWDNYELANDREWSTLVDPVDIDESNMVVSIANLTRAMNIEQKLPEMDRYMFSKLYKEKQRLFEANVIKDNGIHNEELTMNNVLEKFDAMMMNFDEKRVPSSNRILYVTPKVNGMIKNASAAGRSIGITGDKGSIYRSVYSLDDVSIKVVPSDLMQSDYDFTVGSEPLDDAKQINMILINNGVQIAPQKYSFVGLDAPTANNDGNYNYYERAYEDVFLLNHKAEGLEMYVSDKPKPSQPQTPPQSPDNKK